MRRIERLINLVAALLETSRPMTAEEIRTRIAGYEQSGNEAFRRAFERDKQELREMGIPLEVVQTDVWADRPAGYIIPKERYYLPDLGLEPDEVAALNVAAQVVLSGGEEAETGALKLSLSEGDTSLLSGPRFVWGADVGAEQPLLGALYGALIERRGVRFSYLSGKGNLSTREIDPYGLVRQGGSWYVIGRDAASQETRTFKVARISSDVERLDATYEVPDSFDAGAHLREAWEIGAEAPERSIVRFDESMRWWAEQNMAGRRLQEGPHGSLEVELSVGNVAALVSWALQFGDSVEVLSPEAARAEMRRRLGPFVGARRI